jgi:hypothetical protein
MVKRARARGRSGRWLWLPRFFTGARPAVLAGARLMRSSNRGRRWGREGLEIIAYRGDPCRHCADRRPRECTELLIDRSIDRPAARAVGLQAIDSSR